MSIRPSDERTLTELDHARLERLLHDGAADPYGALSQLLDGATLVPSAQVGDDIVTMNSEVRIEADDGSERRVVIRYPSDADPASGAVSVLSPAGTGILGSRVGSRVSWRGADGSPQRHRVTELLYQPERSGELLR